MFTSYFKAMGQYATFSGRTSRYDGWMYSIVVGIIQVIAALGDHVSGMYDQAGALSIVACLFHSMPSLALLVRRCHDIGHSGWWVLLSFVPVINIFSGFYFLLRGSEPGPNAYGPNPYGDDYDPLVAHRPPLRQGPLFGSEIDQLEKLSAMRSFGTITDEEFDTLKRRIMGSQNRR